MDRTSFLKARKEMQADVAGAFSLVEPLGFTSVVTIGLRPHISCRRELPWSLCIDFWMAWEGEGAFPSRWTRESPVELGASATIDRTEAQHHVRYWRTFMLYAHRSYSDALVTLEVDLIQVARTVLAWSEEDIVVHGTRVGKGQR